MIFLSFFCLSIPKRDLNTKKTPPNIEVCPESLRFMLEYWYIERGLLVFVLNGCSLAHLVYILSMPEIQRSTDASCLVGVSNGPIQFESARKIWPLLELLAKIR